MLTAVIEPTNSLLPGAAAFASTSDIARGTSRYGTRRVMLWLSGAETGVNVIRPADSRYESAVAFDDPAVAAGTFSVTLSSAAPPAGTVTNVLLSPIECGEP